MKSKQEYICNNCGQRFKPSIVVLSQNEIHPKAGIKTVGQI